MLIALDIGNSHIHIGGVLQRKLIFTASIATDEKLTSEQYACQIKDVLALYDVSLKKIEGVVLCSVVPAVTLAVKQAMNILTGISALSVASGVKTGLQIRVDNPKALGSDLVANAVYAECEGKFPCIVVDAGTVTTFTILDKNGALVGTAIAPGIKSSLTMLRQVAAQLPSIVMEAPSRGVIGRNTTEAMKSGTVYGAAAMIDGMIDRINKELGGDCHVVLCGGTAAFIAPYLSCKAHIDISATLKGLVEIWHKNHKG